MPIEQTVHAEGDRLTFKRQLRLTRPEEFTRVFKEARRKSDGLLTLLYAENGLTHPRLGLAIAKKSLRRAHERNRVKRIVREQVRLQQHQLVSVDIVVMCRPAAQTVDNAVLASSFNRLLKKASLFRESIG